jgi:ATP-dependent protease HslVU (ClpYQ) peptidase subunit
MSTIVIVRKHNQACIAADSLTSFGDTKQSAEFVANADKILEFHGQYLGLVGSAAHQLVMQSLLLRHADKIDFSGTLAIFETLNRIHPILKEEYYLNAKDEDEDDYESSRIDALLLTRRGIYGLYALREVDEYTRFWAIGSGSEFALGAMHSVYDQLDSAEAIAEAGIRAGAAFDNGSALPLQSHCIELAID